MDGPHLIVKTIKGSDEIALDDQPITIGRHSQNRLPLADSEASRFHCVIERAGDVLRVRDLDSRNGTWVKGQQIKTVELADGDVVTIGQTEIQIALPKPPTPEPVFEEPEVEVEVEEPNFGVETTEASDGAECRQVLLDLAESLPDKSFGEFDITLLNARGKVAHAAKPPGKDGKKGRATPEQAKEPVALFRLLLLICFRIRATDIHLEHKSEHSSVRIRVDGNMVDVVRVSKDMGIRLSAVVKVLSDIDIAQRNIVQEGHFSARLSDRRVDYRISFAPAMYGQKLVIRILDTANTPMYVWDLQLPDWMLEDLQHSIQQEAGMLLVCGPTGSGKTTTLYSLVRSIDVGERNVVTIEDPVEIQLEGVTQIPVNEAQGNTFAALLRSVLRQDPDAILVGEVRDPETARTALQSAITGHLVFSTIHARDTIGTVFRLQDLGIEPYLVASGLQRVLAQRLVRQLCPHCKKPVKPTEDQLKKMGPAHSGLKQIFTSVGCQRCLNTGFAGRRGVYELLVINDAVRDAIMHNTGIAEIKKTLDTKFTTLLQTGYQLVAEGATSFIEVERAVGN